MRTATAMLCVLLASCTGSALAPAPLDTRNDACASCRMSVSTPRFAAQLLVRGEDPRFFDDIGCLADYLKASGAPARAWAAYAGDHRTGEWVPIQSAVFTRAPGIETPMASHLVAHATGASRDADPAATGGTPVPWTDLFPSLAGPE